MKLNLKVGYQANLKTVAAWLTTISWLQDDEEVDALLNALDAQRKEGSRCKTARELIELLPEPADKPGLGYVLRWLYYRH